MGWSGSFFTVVGAIMQLAEAASSPKPRLPPSRYHQHLCGPNQFLTRTVPRRDCHVGTIDNIPAFQRRVGCEQKTSPEGTAEDKTNSAVPSGSRRDSSPSLRVPGVETPGYSREVPPGLTLHDVAQKLLCAPKRLGPEKDCHPIIDDWQRIAAKGEIFLKISCCNPCSS